ncbi:hypothetical protein FB45DRAFT_887088 [Roridomyces roridus]|uniref:Uncharacterized protein n=1 Tax=Roridomyces roridus TaxID=1738132 RepID=A0AAD7G282_9AGAR|nr:hypothetical protein FB45DRAFT_887088 [Roridomyces roridus]
MTERDCLVQNGGRAFESVFLILKNTPMFQLKRPISILAVSALSMWYSVVPPKVAQHPVVTVTTSSPPIPQYPGCPLGSYVPDSFAVCPNTNYTVPIVNVFAGLAFTQRRFDAYGTIVAVPAHPTHLARRKLARIDLARVDINNSGIALPSFVDLANFKVASLDLDIIERAEGVFTIAFAVARFVKRRPGITWTKLAISLLALSGLLVWDGLQLGEPALVILSLHYLVAIVWFATRSRRLQPIVLSFIHGPVLPILFSIVDAQPLDFLYAFASETLPLLPWLLPGPWRDILWPPPIPRVRKKRKPLFKRQRVKARLAMAKSPQFYSFTSLRESFLLSLPTLIFLPFDVPFVDIGHGLLLNGTIVDLLAHHFLFVRVLLYHAFPPPSGRPRRDKKRYKRGRKGLKPI